MMEHGATEVAIGVHWPVDLFLTDWLRLPLTCLATRQFELAVPLVKMD
jgi:hypothetical protein